MKYHYGYYRSAANGIHLDLRQETPRFILGRNGAVVFFFTKWFLKCR